jgi:flavin-dependent dehydrogenase
MESGNKLKVSENSMLALDSGSRVGVIGAGPAGSFFSLFLLQLAQRMDMDIHLDIYESRDFAVPGPTGCNMCAGVISESLVQSLSVEGINLPPGVVQRGIDAYIMHSEEETITIHTPLDEMRIATVHRGSGPKDIKDIKWKSFDRYLLELALDKGANLVHGRVKDITWNGEKPQIEVKDTEPQVYDLIVGATGVNSPSLSLFEKLGIQYQRPKVRKAFLTELPLGFDTISKQLGSSMHVFLLNLPGLDFAALIPKGDYVTMCLIGDNIDKQLIDTFTQHPSVQGCFPGGESITAGACHCSPQASLGDARHPFGDRVVMIGDSGVARLNKDGIGSAYRTAKAAATTAIFEGISSEDFRKHYWPICRYISRDNSFGSVIFTIVNLMKRVQFSTSGVLRMAKAEQQKQGKYRRMSSVLWDMFTGSAPYRDVFIRTLHPSFIGRLLWTLAVGFWPAKNSKRE